MNNPHRYKSIIGSDKANPKKEVKIIQKKAHFLFLVVIQQTLSE